MKKVYIVYKWLTDGGYSIVAVCSTLELALSYIENFNNLTLIKLEKSYGEVFEYYDSTLEPSPWSQRFDTDQYGRLMYKIMEIPLDIKL